MSYSNRSPSGFVDRNAPFNTNLGTSIPYIAPGKRQVHHVGRRILPSSTANVQAALSSIQGRTLELRRQAREQQDLAAKELNMRLKKLGGEAHQLDERRKRLIDASETLDEEHHLAQNKLIEKELNLLKANQSLDQEKHLAEREVLERRKKISEAQLTLDKMRSGSVDNGRSMDSRVDSSSLRSSKSAREVASTSISHSGSSDVPNAGSDVLLNITAAINQVKKKKEPFVTIDSFSDSDDSNILAPGNDVLLNISATIDQANKKKMPSTVSISFSNSDASDIPDAGNDVLLNISAAIDRVNKKNSQAALLESFSDSEDGVEGVDESVLSSIDRVIAQMQEPKVKTDETPQAAPENEKIVQPSKSEISSDDDSLFDIENHASAATQMNIGAFIDSLNASVNATLTVPRQPPTNILSIDTAILSTDDVSESIDGTVSASNDGRVLVPVTGKPLSEDKKILYTQEVLDNYLDDVRQLTMDNRRPTAKELEYVIFYARRDKVPIVPLLDAYDEHTSGRNPFPATRLCHYIRLAVEMVESNSLQEEFIAMVLDGAKEENVDVSILESILSNPSKHVMYYEEVGEEVIESEDVSKDLDEKEDTKNESLPENSAEDEEERQKALALEDEEKKRKEKARAQRRAKKKARAMKKMKKLKALKEKKKDQAIKKQMKLEALKAQRLQELESSSGPSSSQSEYKSDSDDSEYSEYSESSGESVDSEQYDKYEGKTGETGGESEKGEKLDDAIEVTNGVEDVEIEVPDLEIADGANGSDIPMTTSEDSKKIDSAPKARTPSYLSLKIQHLAQAQEKVLRDVEAQKKNLRGAADVSPVDATESMKLVFGRKVFKDQPRIIPFKIKHWKLSMRSRRSCHPGYEGVESESLMQTACQAGLKHRHEHFQWELLGTELKGKKSIENGSNWFGEFATSRQAKRILQSTIQPQIHVDIKGLVYPKQWEEEWYTTWLTRKHNFGKLEQRGEKTIGSRYNPVERPGTINSYRSSLELRSDSQFDSPESLDLDTSVGKIITMRYRAGERLSRVHYDYTSFLHKSRWKKRYFPKGIFSNT